MGPLHPSGAEGTRSGSGPDAGPSKEDDDVQVKGRSTTLSISLISGTRLVESTTSFIVWAPTRGRTACSSSVQSRTSRRALACRPDTSHRPTTTSSRSKSTKNARGTAITVAFCTVQLTYVVRSIDSSAY